MDPHRTDPEPHNGFTRDEFRIRQFNYALQECQWLAKQYNGPCRPASVEGVFAMDDAIPEGLWKSLLSAIATVRNRPAIGSNGIDRHPGTINVIDLVHPSLYCYCQGTTPVLTGIGAECTHSDFPTLLLARSNNLLSVEKPRVMGPTLFPSMYSRHGLQWLPSEFRVTTDSSSTSNGKEHCEIHSYINCLHPVLDCALYSLIGELFLTVVPALENVLAELQPWTNIEDIHGLGTPTPAKVIRNPRLSVGRYWWKLPGENEVDGKEESNMDGWDGTDEWYELRVVRQPEIPDFAPPSYNVNDAVDVSLKDRPLQVIVKLATLELQPGDVYEGVWHVEGTLDERIVATACCYLESENIQGGNLDFRAAVLHPPDYEQDDRIGVLRMYGLEDGGLCVQDFGRCVTRQGRILAWPNTLQHKVSNITLIDPTMPGKRTIVCFFLVDPTCRVRSTATVPPQQLAWYRDEIDASLCQAFAETAVCDKVIQNVASLPGAGLLTYEEACERRLILMDERKNLFAGDEQRRIPPFFERIISLCEH